jgi:2,3-bisphosphoglycerate-independent phosphoglycerate mutase
MEESVEILSRHPVNAGRMAEEKSPANSIWLWGQGTSPRLPSFQEQYGLTGAVISAVDLVRGIAVLAQLEVIRVSGATGYLDTNYRGKLEAALETLKKDDFAYIHVEAPDEASHTGRLELKLQAIEDFDREIVGQALNFFDGWKGKPKLSEGQEVRVLVVIDHRTPLSLMTHSPEPVPFAFYPEDKSAGSGLSYDEISAEKSGIFIENGSDLMKFYLGI